MKTEEILVDSNVLLDVLEDDPRWAEWSQDQLDAASATDRLVINPVIYSELSIGFTRIEELEPIQLGALRWTLRTLHNQFRHRS